jgi:drug/metabolite transporter (DMT)-like permease
MAAGRRLRVAQEDRQQEPTCVHRCGRFAQQITKTARPRVTLAAFIATSVLAGGNGVGIRFSNRELDPLWGAALRFSAAALVLLIVMAAMRLKLPRSRALAGAALFGALNFSAAFALAYLALVHLHAGFGQVLLSTVPLATLLLAVLWRQERLTAAAVTGTLLALAGVGILLRESLTGPVPLASILAAIGSAVCLPKPRWPCGRFLESTRSP